MLGFERPAWALAMVASSLIVIGATAPHAAEPNTANGGSVPTGAEPTPAVESPGGEEMTHYRSLLGRLASENPRERVAAITELGEATPRSKNVVQLLRRIAWHSDRPDEREAAGTALAEIGVELGEPPAEERSWLAGLGTTTLMLAARSLLESFETERSVRDAEESLDRRVERQRERAEIAANAAK